MKTNIFMFRFKDKYNRVMEHLSSSSKGEGETKIQEDNVGNKMLQVKYT